MIKYFVIAFELLISFVALALLIQSIIDDIREKKEVKR